MEDSNCLMKASLYGLIVYMLSSIVVAIVSVVSVESVESGVDWESRVSKVAIDSVGISLRLSLPLADPMEDRTPVGGTQGKSSVSSEPSVSSVTRIDRMSGVCRVNRVDEVTIDSVGISLRLSLPLADPMEDRTPVGGAQGKSSVSSEP